MTLRLTRVQAERRAALRVVLAQGVITALVAAVAVVGWGLAAGKSAAWGGGIGIVATLFMVMAVFRYPDGASALRIAWGFYLGQFLKVALSIAMLVVAFGSQGVVPLALLAGYLATFAGYWASPRQPLPRR